MPAEAAQLNNLLDDATSEEAKQPRSIALQHREEILRRVANGEAISKIAQDYGYASHGGILNRMEGDQELIAAQRAGLIARMERREIELEAADTNVTVTRADRLLGHARWLAERLDSSRWGQVNKLQVEQVGDLGDRLRRSRERVIDVQPVDNVTNAAQQPENNAENSSQ